MSALRLMTHRSSFIAVIIIILLGLFVPLLAPGRSNEKSSDKSHQSSTRLVCSMSAFFSVESGDAVVPVSDLDGRGLISCTTDQGFSTEYPVLFDLKAELPPGVLKNGEITFSGNSSSFVVPRDIGQIEDSYRIRVLDLEQRLNKPMTLVLRGKKHDLVIEMKFTSQIANQAPIKVRTLSLHFDDSAPDLF